MKSKRLLVLAIYTFDCAASISGRAQGTIVFQNLDFESANVTASGVEPYGYFVPIGSAVPGWTASLGSEQLTQIGYNSPTAGTATISLIGPNWNIIDTDEFHAGIIDGNYSVLLQSGGSPTNDEIPVNASIAQNGTVPATAESLMFEASVGGSMSVSFAGNTLDPIALSSGQSADGLPYTFYGVNISAWAGQTGELQFTAGIQGHESSIVLDDISFSENSVVPEPSPLTLMLMAGVALGVRHWRAKGS